MATVKKPPAVIAAKFGCTVEQARAQLLATAKDCRACATKAGAGKYRGFTAQNWTDEAVAFETAATN